MNAMRRSALLIISLLCLSNCGQGKEVKITFVQMNDVYEMLPLGNDRGGLARVATLKKELAQTAHTYAFMAGDFVSPSAVGTAKINGKRLAGEQMIDTLNTLGLDFATIGNHEFDIDEDALLSRIAESKFKWVSSNVYHKTPGLPFPEVAPRIVFNVEGKLDIGIFSVTLDQAKKDWVAYDMNLVEIARREVAALKAEGAEIIIGLTHLTMEQDKMIAREVEGIDLIMGGHEHEAQSNTEATPVFKADANAQTVYLHHLTYDTKTGKLSMQHQLQVIDNNLADDPATQQVAQEWFDKAIVALNVDPNEAVVTPTEDLDGREANIRNGETNLTHILAEGMYLAGKEQQIDASIYNAGSIRIDDLLRQGVPMSGYDVLRVLPFGGTHNWCEIKGDLLGKVLDQGLANTGAGGYLQKGNITGTTGAWLVNGQPLDAETWYKVTFSDYLLTGLELGLADLKCSADECPGESLKYGGVVGEFQEALVIGLKQAFP